MIPNNLTGNSQHEKIINRIEYVLKYWFQLV